MKKSILFLSMFAGTFAFAQDCSELFISEYVEGWSNNKALEIYNPTSSPIDLSNYFVARYSNGATTAAVKNAVQLSGTIQPYDVYVAVIDKRDPNGEGQEAPVWDSLQAKADGFYSPDYDNSNAFYWNGNDAVLLAKGTLPSSPTANITTASGFTIVDVFAKIGENPANESGSNANNDGGWSTQYPYNTGQGVIVTIDHSLIRKSTVLKGTVSNPSVFNPLGEWDSIPAVVPRLDENGNPIFNANTGSLIVDGNWSSLGSHSCNCDPFLGVEHVQEEGLSVYPNPTNGTVYVKGMKTASVIEVYNSLGQKIETVKADKTIVSINLDGSKGVYLVKLIDAAGNQTVKRVVLK